MSNKVTSKSEACGEEMGPGAICVDSYREKIDSVWLFRLSVDRIDSNVSVEYDCKDTGLGVSVSAIDGSKDLGYSPLRRQGPKIEHWWHSSSNEQLGYIYTTEDSANDTNTMRSTWTIYEMNRLESARSHFCSLLSTLEASLATQNSITMRKIQEESLQQPQRPHRDDHWCDVLCVSS